MARLNLQELRLAEKPEAWCDAAVFARSRGRGVAFLEHRRKMCCSVRCGTVQTDSRRRQSFPTDVMTGGRVGADPPAAWSRANMNCSLHLVPRFLSRPPRQGGTGASEGPYEKMWRH